MIARSDFGTPTVVWLPMPPIAGGFDYGQGLAVRKMPAGGWHAGHWHLYTSTFIAGRPNREPLLEYEVPATLSGAATFVQVIGGIPHYGKFSGDSVFFDDPSGRLCVSSGLDYTYANGQNTLACAEIDAATGRLKAGARAWGFQVCDASDSCTPRPDRMTQSGVFRIRNEAIAQRLKGHYVAGFGGTYSIVTNGVSMGLAGCAFELPPQSFSGRITCTPIVGYPNDKRLGHTFMNRDGDYVQVLGWDNNRQRGSDAVAKYGTGKFAPEDGLSGMAADIIDLPGAEAFVGVAEMQRGCIGYGDNHFNLPPIVIDGPAVTPAVTDIATGVVTIPASWDTGQMVNVLGQSTPAVRAGSGGLVSGGYTVYFLRRVGPRAYTFHRNLDEARSAAGIVPASTDVTTNRVKFVRPHGLRTQMRVTVQTEGGGLAAGVLPVSYCQAPAAPYPYPGGAVGSQGARHVLYFHGLDDLAAVVRGEKAQNAIQPTSFANLDLPGVTYPAPGMNKRPITGAQWIPELARFAIAWNDTSPTRQGRRIAFYPVGD